LRELLSQRGACFFRELTGEADGVTLDALWDLVWAGEVTNDSFAPVRALSAKRRAGGKARGGRPRLGSLTVLGPPRAQGRWSLLTRELGDPGAVSPTEAAAALAGLLLDRHGVLTREAARGEGVPGGFAAVYPVLRAMEESGRIRRGYFVTGLGGAQFALPGAVDRLRAFREGVPEGFPGAVVLAATDPANPYGVALPWPETEGARPQRAAGAFVVLVDGLASLYVEKGGRGLAALRALDGTWEGQAVTALGGLVAGGRLSRLSLERFPSVLEPLLRAADFVPTPKGLVRYA
jgi:ATP-dependent Lhr-like helicase